MIVSVYNYESHGGCWKVECNVDRTLVEVVLGRAGAFFNRRHFSSPLQWDLAILNEQDPNTVSSIVDLGVVVRGVMCQSLAHQGSV